jgi:uncharacterized membrane protein YbhN (UPF0104 family)
MARMRVASGGEGQLTATPEAEPKEDGPKKKVEKPWRKWAKKVLAVAIVVLALWGAYEHRSEISSAGSMFSQLKVAWLLLAIVAELGSMVVFARLQRWLLRAGGVDVPFVPMVEITLAGNAMSTTLPGGAAWSATWVFEQLRRRGAQKVLAGWVILAAGLAAIPLLVAAGYVLARRSNRVRQLMSSSWNAISRRLPPARALGNLVHKTVVDLGLVHPGFFGWVEVFGLALANWLCDCLCLLACTEALGVPVPWRGILVIYGLTQVAASIPITPGGIGVVEGSMTALLIAYGVHATSAVAVVLLYRIISFWGLAPIGWAAWAGLELALRHGLRTSPHPWADHEHGPWADHEHGPDALPAHASIGPDKVVHPSPCMGCEDGAAPVDLDEPTHGAGTPVGAARALSSPPGPVPGSG